MQKCVACGMELDDNAKFCQSCGTSVSEIKEEKTVPSKGKAKKPSPVIFFAIGAIVTIGILAFLLFFGVLDNNNSKEVALDYCKAIGTFNSKKLINVIYTDGFTKEEKKRIETMYDDYDEMLEEFGYKFISCKAGKTENASKEDLDILEEELESMYGKKVDVKEAKTVTITLTMKINDEKSSNDDEVITFKVGSKWYVYFEE